MHVSWKFKSVASCETLNERRFTKADPLDRKAILEINAREVWKSTVDRINKGRRIMKSFALCACKGRVHLIHFSVRFSNTALAAANHSLGIVSLRSFESSRFDNAHSELVYLI